MSEPIYLIAEVLDHGLVVESIHSSLTKASLEILRLEEDYPESSWEIFTTLDRESWFFGEKAS